MATILIVGVWLVDAGSLSVGATTTAMLLYLQLFGPIRALMFVVDDLQSATASMGRIVGVIDEAETCGIDAERPVGAQVLTPEKGGPIAVRAERVAFGYRADRPVLQEVSLRVGRGARRSRG